MPPPAAWWPSATQSLKDLFHVRTAGRDLNHHDAVQYLEDAGHSVNRYVCLNTLHA